MGSVAKPRCARGQDCYHVRSFHHIDKPPTVPREGDLCGRCQTEHAGGLQASDSARWIPEALEALFPGESGRRSLWDLFELDPHNGGWRKNSDRGEAFSRLDARTLKHLRGWLEEHWDEATARYGPGRLRGLWTDVCLFGRFGSMPPDESLFPQDRDSTLPLNVMGYTSSGRAVDMMVPIKLLMLREQPGYMSEGDLAEAVGLPRTTLREMLKRMKEIGFSMERKFTTDELAYVAMGGRRGRRENRS